MNFIKKYFQRRREKKERAKLIVESLIKDYEELIQVYKSVQERTSGLSRKQREFVTARVHYLVEKGHLKVNK